MAGAKRWTNTGLEDFDSWWPTERGRGLVYRGDADMEFMNNRHDITVLEFKQAGENLGRAQLSWLRVRAKQEKTEVRVVREVPGEIPDDPARTVVLWNPLEPWSSRRFVPLTEVREWAESRAYTKEAPIPKDRGLLAA